MIRPIFPASTALCSAVAALFLTGCDKPQIRVYTVAKEAPPATPAPAAAASSAPGDNANAAHPRMARPQVTYTLPQGWEEKGSNSLSLANFVIPSDQGDATVSITPLPGMKGREKAIANMWRAQVGQPELSDQDAATGFAPVEIAGSTGQLFEIKGSREGKSLYIVTAFTHRDDQSWFYKLQGSEAVVTAQKPAFLEFLKTVKIKDGEPAAAPATAGTAPDATTTGEPAPAPAMVAPEGWQAVAPGQMQFAKFAVATKDGAKADVSVSIFPSDTGGTLANVNRWRRQLGLADTDEAGLQECVTPLEGGDSIAGAPGAILADLSHENRRMLGAIVPRGGRWWFYKIMGDAAAVNAERENFVHFVKTQP